MTDRRYGWPAECIEQFGQAPAQLLHEWNTVAHVGEYEGDPRRRPLTYDEVQALFDAADGLVDDIRARGRKGALAAQRDAVLLKTVYAYGLRRAEAWGLDLSDTGRNPKAARFGRFGCVNVRFGKASRGSPPKRRTVLTVPEMDWVVPVLEQWIDEVRPLFGPGAHPALWVSERRGRLSKRSINEAFGEVRNAAGLPEELDLHCLRHSYVTHLVEFGYPAKFVQGSSWACLPVHHGDLYRGVRRVPQPAGGTVAGPPAPAADGSITVIAKMGIRWNLRRLMAAHDMFATTDLVPLLAERGIELSREQVFRLVTQTPQRLSMDTLAALCDIFGCTPNELIEVEVVHRQRRKTAGATGSTPPPVRRTKIRRPET